MINFVLLQKRKDNDKFLSMTKKLQIFLLNEKSKTY